MLVERKLMSIKKPKTGEEFQQNAKPYVVNMIRKSGTLHIKNTDNCPWSVFLTEYVDFDTLEDAKGNEVFKRCCKRCFK